MRLRDGVGQALRGRDWGGTPRCGGGQGGTPGLGEPLASSSSPRAVPAQPLSLVISGGVVAEALLAVPSFSKPCTPRVWAPLEDEIRVTVWGLLALVTAPVVGVARPSRGPLS